MDPITTASLLFSGISKVTKLFTAGKKLKEEMTGESSQATNADELKSELLELSPDQQGLWVQTMNQKLKTYEAETERLKVLEAVSTTIGEKVDSETASDIAYQRQTTRPWTVKKMVHLMLFPFYLIAIDVFQNLIKNWLLFWTDKVQPFESFIYVFGSKDSGLMDKLGNLIGPMPKTLAGQMYIEAIAWAAAIVISYMGLREIGKARGMDKTDGIIKKAANVIKKTGFFGKIFGK